jgi:hypothetical protein
VWLLKPGIGHRDYCLWFSMGLFRPKINMRDIILIVEIGDGDAIYDVGCKGRGQKVIVYWRFYS